MSVLRLTVRTISIAVINERRHQDPDLEAVVASPSLSAASLSLSYRSSHSTPCNQSQQ